MNLPLNFTPSLYPGLIDRRSKSECSFLWQRKYKGVVLRISLRTKDEGQALNRYVNLTSAFIKLKQLGIPPLTIKSNLNSLRDRFVDSHLLESICQMVSPTQQAEVTLSPSLSHTLKEWVSEMDRDWSPQTMKLNEDRVLGFIKWKGDVHLHDVTKKDISEYKLHLDKAYKSPHTRQSGLTSISGLFNFAINKRGYLNKNPLKGMLYKNVKSLSKKENITPAEHLLALENTKDAELKWLMNILWYTGMRIGEAAQLSKKDYVIVDGIHCFSINDDGDKTIKNSNSIRCVPIHKDLIEFGIMEIKPVFHWRTVGSAGDRVRIAFKKVNLKRTPHCYRYSMSDRLRDLVDIPDHVRYSILGHAHSTTTDKVYRNKQPITLMKNAIDRT